MSHLTGTIIPNQIRRYRKKRCLRTHDVAKLIGHSSDTDFYYWESGKKLPSLRNALKLSAVLGCPVEILFLDLFNQTRREMSARKRFWRIGLS